VTKNSRRETRPDKLQGEIDVSLAQSPRAYDYLQGGVAHFAADREAVDQIMAAAGGIEKARKRVRASRRFQVRAVRYLAGDAGVRQFLDLGTGIPNADNVHTVAQATAPDCRVVSVDNDPVVLAYAHQLQASTAGGGAAYIDGDLQDAEGILSQAAATLDLNEPVALVFVGVLLHFRDDEDPWAIVRRYVEAVASGSYLVIEHTGIESDDVANYDEVVRTIPAAANFTLFPRSRDQVARFFEGLELVEPGLVFIENWRPDRAPDEYEIPLHGAVGRKP
jgi:SAM-dependent methyltransferase